MKNTQRSHLVLLALCLIAFACFLGCRTSTYKRGEMAARSLQNAATEVQIQSQQLSLTMSSLEDLVNKPGADLRPQFKLFSENLDRLEASARRNDKAAEAALKKNALYLASWDLQITNMNYEVVRSRSEARRTEVGERFKSVHNHYREARTAMQPLLTYLKDIRRALGSDLTRGGLQSVKPIVANARENAQRVQTSLTKLTSELADSGARLSSVPFQDASSRTNMAAH